MAEAARVTPVSEPIAPAPFAAAPVAPRGARELHAFVEAVMRAEREEAARLSPRLSLVLVGAASTFLWIALGAIVL